MARLIPDYLPADSPSEGEYDLCLRLQNDSETADWVVLHSLDIAKHSRKVTGEIDFVVIIPSLGVLCLEVKACRRLHRNQLGWYYGSDNNADPRGPFKQASQGMHSLMAYLKENHPDLIRPIFWSAVVFPYVNFNESSPEWHPWQVIDARMYFSQPISRSLVNILLKARQRLENTPDATWFRPDSRIPSIKQSEQLAEALRPKFEFYEHPSARRNRLKSELKYFTDEQLTALTTMELNPRVLFQGAAGTGKTFLALEAARRGAVAGRKVLLLCYNKLLGEWLDKETEAIRSKVTVRRLHQYMVDVSGVTIPSDTQNDFWRTTLPERAIEALLEKSDETTLYDELIIDEAQDVLYETYLDILDISLKGGLSAGRWRIFGDFSNQAIYTQNLEPLSPLEFSQKRGGNPTFYTLNTNCRNTPRIASWAEILGRLSPGYERIRRSDDRVEPQIESYSTQEEQQRLLAKHLETLYSQGYQGQDIIVLSTRAGEKAAAHSLHESPWKDRIKAFSFTTAGFIRYSTIHAFKGLESPTIIVTDVDTYDTRSIALLFVATTRALDRLIVLIDNRAYKQVVRYLTGDNN